MGLFSKLFGDNNPFDDIIDQLGKNDPDSVDLNQENRQEQVQSRSAGMSGGSYEASRPGGSSESWPMTVPEEENQYNYNGSYIDYFMHVLKEDFPEYTLEKESIRHGYATLIYLWQGNEKVLCIELMSETCSVQKIRNECRTNGIRYLRFYYNHRPWWNTRRYVTGRVGAALSTPANLFWQRR